jgi:hypothetical protein
MDDSGPKAFLTGAINARIKGCGTLLPLLPAALLRLDSQDAAAALPMHHGSRHESCHGRDGEREPMEVPSSAALLPLPSRHRIDDLGHARRPRSRQPMASCRSMLTTGGTTRQMMSSHTGGSEPQDIVPSMLAEVPLVPVVPTEALYELGRLTGPWAALEPASSGECVRSGAASTAGRGLANTSC